MYHDFAYKHFEFECHIHRGMMSYYRRVNDAEKLQSMWGEKWNDVWTECNQKDLKEWWNKYGKKCDTIGELLHK